MDLVHLSKNLTFVDHAIAANDVKGPALQHIVLLEVPSGDDIGAKLRDHWRHGTQYDIKDKVTEGEGRFNWGTQQGEVALRLAGCYGLASRESQQYVYILFNDIGVNTAEVAGAAADRLPTAMRFDQRDVRYEIRRSGAFGGYVYKFLR
jgi:hypothetical protein